MGPCYDPCWMILRSVLWASLEREGEREREIYLYIYIYTYIYICIYGA